MKRTILLCSHLSTHSPPRGCAAIPHRRLTPGAISPSPFSFIATLLLASPILAQPLPIDEDSSRERLEHEVAFLAGDELDGRLTGTEGAFRASQHLAAELEQFGARSLPGNKGYLVPFDFTAGAKDAGSSLVLKTDAEQRPFAGDSLVQALSFSDNGTAEGELMFVGYGLRTPESQGFAYDSYATLDVRDKIVVALRYFPEDAEGDVRATLARYSGLRYKAMTARQLGAKALLLVTGPRSPNAWQTTPMTFDTAIAGSGIVAASLGGEAAQALFSAAGKNLEEVQAELDTANPHVAGFKLQGVVAHIEVRVEREHRRGFNVAGVLPRNPFARPVAKPWVVVGAHYDHLGRGGGGNSLARDNEAGQIHHGADDNASGVAAVLEIAARIAAAPRARNVVVAFWSGEELGLLGSAAFLEEAQLPVEQIAAYVNLDMVGRSRDNRLSVQAAGSSPAWKALAERANLRVGFDLELQNDPYLPTDSASFDRRDIPTINLFTGSHPDYHRPSDTAEKIEYAELVRVADLAGEIVRRLANAEEPPEFVRVERQQQAGGDRDTVRVSTGTIPDYATDVDGLLLGGVMPGGPADEAGLKQGDVIVQFGELTIKNIYDYTYALDTVKADVPIAVVFLRDGERHQTIITPRARR